MSDMTRDDIIRLGRESQRECFSDGGHWFSMEVRDLERFAALVAAAAEQPKPEPPKPHGYAYRYRDGIRFNGGNTVNGGLPVEVLPYWFAPPDTEALRRENERLNADIESWRQTMAAATILGEKVTAENERLREENRQNRLWQARAVALLWKHDADITTDRLQSAAKEIDAELHNEAQKLERFAALVEAEAAARENEACAKVIDEIAERHKEQSDATYWALRDAAFLIRNRKKV